MLFYKAQIYCMFVIVVLFAMCWFGIKQRTKESKLFNTILFCGFINMVFDIASNYTVNHLETVHPVTNRVIHICFFMSLTILFLLAYLYLAAIVEKELGRKLKGKKLSYLPCIFVFVINIFSPLYYMENPTANYSYGVGVYALYVCVAGYMGLIVWHMYNFRNNISRKNKMVVTLGLVSVMGSSIFQLFIPEALTSSLGVTLFCLFMYMTVASPDAVLIGMLKEETARADAANRAKSDFIAKMSHEIRTPINAVIGMNEMILRESTENEVKKYAYDAKSAGNTLLSIVNEILDSSKIESGKLEIIPVNYEIYSLFNDLYNMIGLKAKKKGLKLVFDIDQNMPVGYFGDDIRIRQVLVNLLTNAVKYTEHGTVTLTVRVEKDEEVAIVWYSVSDTGIGIKDEDLGKLYNKFERIEESRNRSIEGTGLGMSIVVQLLELMDSKLNVKSEYGKGSEFSFAIRQKVTNLEPIGDFYTRIENDALEYGSGPSYYAGDAKVLVVDDNEVNRKVVRGFLKQSKIQVHEAGSGQECLDMLEREKYDLLFLDYMMPFMDGVETLHIIRERKLCENTPIIMFTANAVVGAKEKFIEEGFDDYLTKPVMPEKLDKIILKYLPQNLLRIIENTPDSKDNNEDADMPQLDEFDFDYALSLLKSKEMVLGTLEEFYNMLGGLPEKLSLIYENIERKDDIKMYRIEVHALKSTSALVGAMLLSKLARLLEIAASEENVTRIHALHPILLEEIEKHRLRISTIFPQEDKIDITDVEELMSYFDMLKVNLQNGDYNTADFVCDEIKKYKYPDNIDVLVDKILGQVRNLQAEEAISNIECIRREWK